MIVVKYGGNAMGDAPDAFIAQCAAYVRTGAQLVLVHGGGPQIDAALRELGIPERRLAGLRVTDEKTLETTERVLCGSVNKSIVRAFYRLGIAAVGISGEDAGLITARRQKPILIADEQKPQSLGFVGEIVAVAPKIIFTLLEAGFLPVIAPLGISGDGTEYYNINADTAAGAIAAALEADPYIVITDVPKVRRNPHDASTGINRMNLAEARELLKGGSFDGGMLPKMQAILQALEAGAISAIVTGGEHALAKAFAGDGTVIVR